METKKYSKTKEKFRILRGAVVVVLIFAWVFSPLGNLVNNYSQKHLPKLVTKTITRVAGVSSVSANTATSSAGADAANTTICIDNMAWSDPGLATNQNDSTYISYTGPSFDATDSSDGLDVTTFGFSLGAGVASIDGFTVKILAWTDAGGADYLDVFLLNGGSRRGEDHAAGSLPTSDPGSTYQSFGGAADDWYAAGSWTQAEVEATTFGVSICFLATVNDTHMYLDHVEVTITYTAAAPADLSWDTGATDFEIWAGATATTDAVNIWDNGTLICSTSLTDDNSRITTCGAINKKQKYRIQAVLKNVGGAAASMAAGDFVDHKNVKTFWAGTSPTISAATNCGFEEISGTDDVSPTCNVAFNGNDVRITQTGTSVIIAATTGSEGFMYLITTDSDVSLSDSSTYMNVSIDSITEDSSRVTIGLRRTPGNYIRGLVRIRGLVKFR